MENKTYQADVNEVQSFLLNIISLQMKELALLSFKQLLSEISTAETNTTFYIAYSTVWKYSGKEKLMLSENDLKRADEIRKGWVIKDWTTDQACRALLLLSLSNHEKTTFVKTLNNLAGAADVSELVALYLALPLLPYPESLCDRAAEGVRNNMTVVYDAIALNNPFPAAYLNENAWNQLVLKGIFNNRPLGQIVNLDQRANEKLAGMISSFAHERWAAGRSVSAEAWRCVAPFINENFLSDIEKVIEHSNPIEQKAAALACATSSFPEAKKLLNQRADLKMLIEEKQLSWQILSEELSNF